MFPGETATLDNGALRLVVATQGGGIVRLDAATPWGVPTPILVPAEARLKGGCQLLVPWSNRISGGGFFYDGHFHAIEPNVKGEDCPLHGDGFQRDWDIVDASRTAIALELAAGVIGPYRYVARASYRLNGTSLVANLTVENRAGMALPYGLGFHPWFARTRATTLQAVAAEVQLQDARHLPTEVAGFDARPDLDFGRARSLPAGWVNNAFLGWDGRAELVLSPEGPRISMIASNQLDTFILYSPSSTAEFFCLEPVSHAVDAHHAGGLARLVPGESMTVAMVLSVAF